jgi:hypothetical protein
MPLLPGEPHRRISSLGRRQTEQPAPAQSRRTSQGSLSLPILQEEVRDRRTPRTQAAVSEESKERDSMTDERADKLLEEVLALTKEQLDQKCAEAGIEKNHRAYLSRIANRAKEVCDDENRPYPPQLQSLLSWLDTPDQESA